MNAMTVFKAAEICGGKLCGDIRDVELAKVVIDSRAVSEGDLFVAYKGEKTDGHSYMQAAFERGAACCLAERVPEGVAGTVILVPDVQEALEKIAAAYRRSLSLPVIGITGSVGKTSAKEMISAVLSAKLRVHKTEGNLNNQIGVPLTLSRITPEHQAAVVEMGISGFGEMSRLAKMARPDIAVFTVIGHAHLEFLRDLDGVLQAKTEMLAFMPEDGTVILNGDDEKLRTVQCPQKKLYFGLSGGCDVRAENITSGENGSTDCDIIYVNRCIHVHIPAYGRHMVYAALEGAAVGIVMGLSDEEIARGIAAYETVGRRGAVTDTGFITLVDDCYNANPDSVKCGIDSLMKLPGRHVCILGDMLELGEDSGDMHYAVGEYAREQGIDLVLACGPLSGEISRAAGEKGIYFETTAGLVAAVGDYIRKGDTVLVKASRAMHFEEVSEALKSLKG